MKIVLIGFMGSGKSTVAKLLGEKLSWPVIEVDDLIIERSGEKSVQEIFQKYGERHFRELEKEVIKEISKKNNIIISPGGGLVLDEENVSILRQLGKVKFYLLDTSFDVIKSRISDVSTRPLFKSETEAQELYNKRLPIYKKLADIVVNTNNCTPEQVLETLLLALNLPERN